MRVLRGAQVFLMQVVGDLLIAIPREARLDVLHDVMGCSEIRPVEELVLVLRRQAGLQFGEDVGRAKVIPKSIHELHETVKFLVEF